MIHMGPPQMAALVGAGLCAGFASGLLGVGGAFVMVPIQFAILKWMGVDPTIAVRISLGTSLLVVLPTAVTSAITHHRNKAVHWRAGVILGSVGATSAVLGAYAASLLSGRTLTAVFGCVSILLAMRMLFIKTPETSHAPYEGLSRLILCGVLFGLVSGLIGVGGGGMMIPVMIRFLGISLHEAVGTSAALMIFTALGGSISYLVSGLGVEGLPAYSTGYLNWLQFALLAVSSIPMAVVGAKAAHMLPTAKLRVAFAMVLFFIGLKMIGVFSWLHLPI